MSDDTGLVAVQLANLRGEISTGLADIKGSLAVLVERSDRAEEDIKILEDKTEKRAARLEARLAAVEKRVWMAAGLGSALGIVSSGLVTSYLVR